jgi:hypothetical protein
LNELRKLQEDLKETKLKLETESNARNKAEMDLDNIQRRITSMEEEQKKKQLALVKENAALIDLRKKSELQITQLQKQASDAALLNKTLAVKIKEYEKKLSSIYRASMFTFGWSVLHHEG